MTARSSPRSWRIVKLMLSGGVSGASALVSRRAGAPGGRVERIA